MKSFNQSILLGFVANEPNIIETANNKQFATFSIAVNRMWEENVGDKSREVDYHKIVAWGKLAKIVQSHIGKGTKLLVSGSLVNHCYEDKEGNEKYITEIHASSIEILSWAKKENQAKEALTADK
jgi:single-strand DNA-binding protein